MTAASQTLLYFIYLKLTWMLQLVTTGPEWETSWFFWLKKQLGGKLESRVLHGSKLCVTLGTLFSLSLKYTVQLRGPLHFLAEPTMVLAMLGQLHQRC